ncbi:MAG: glycosyltransferase family 39 protein, partial [Bacillota bacterium]
MEREARRGKWLRAATRPHMLALYGIVLLSFFLNFFLIGQSGYGNAYYAAAIRSMTQSWHNFFYISFDPAGVVSVDKSPLGLWAQALFVLFFGYHGWAMLLPQALAGALSALMVYVLTERYFGKPAGLIAALTFALTPAVVVASRNNTMDMQLVLALLFAAWFLRRALETGKL